MMIFLANSESWTQKPKGWKFLLSHFVGSYKEAEESIPSMGQQLKRTVKTSLGCFFIIS